MTTRELERTIRDLGRERDRTTDRAEWLRIHQQITDLTTLWAR